MAALSHFVFATVDAESDRTADLVSAVVDDYHAAYRDAGVPHCDIVCVTAEAKQATPQQALAEVAARLERLLDELAAGTSLLVTWLHDNGAISPADEALAPVYGATARARAQFHAPLAMVNTAPSDPTGMPQAAWMAIYRPDCYGHDASPAALSRFTHYVVRRHVAAVWCGTLVVSAHLIGGGGEARILQGDVALLQPPSTSPSTSAAASSRPPRAICPAGRSWVICDVMAVGDDPWHQWRLSPVAFDMVVPPGSEAAAFVDKWRRSCQADAVLVARESRPPSQAACLCRAPSPAAWADHVACPPAPVADAGGGDDGAQDAAGLTLLIHVCAGGHVRAYVTHPHHILVAMAARTMTRAANTNTPLYAEMGAGRADVADVTAELGAVPAVAAGSRASHRATGHEPWHMGLVPSQPEPSKQPAASRRVSISRSASDKYIQAMSSDTGSEARARAVSSGPGGTAARKKEPATRRESDGQSAAGAGDMDAMTRNMAFLVRSVAKELERAYPGDIGTQANKQRSRSLVVACENLLGPAFVTEKVSKKKIVTIVQTALQLMVSSQ